MLGGLERKGVFLILRFPLSYPRLLRVLSCERSNLGGKLCGFLFKTPVGFGLRDCSDGGEKKVFSLFVTRLRNVQGYFLGKEHGAGQELFNILIPPVHSMNKY